MTAQLVGDCGHPIAKGGRLWPVTRFDKTAGHFLPQRICYSCLTKGDDEPEAKELRSPVRRFIEKAAQASRGTRVCTAKLDDQKVREIRQLLKAGNSQVAIARRYGVTQFAIWRISSGRGWRHVA